MAKKIEEDVNARLERIEKMISVLTTTTLISYCDGIVRGLPESNWFKLEFLPAESQEDFDYVLPKLGLLPLSVVDEYAESVKNLIEVKKNYTEGGGQIFLTYDVSFPQYFYRDECYGMNTIEFKGKYYAPKRWFDVFVAKIEQYRDFETRRAVEMREQSNKVLGGK